MKIQARTDPHPEQDEMDTAAKKSPRKPVAPEAFGI
jgi:hypothetical protein